MKTIKIRRNKRVKKADYENKDEFAFNKKTCVVPKRTNRLLCVIFTEDKKADFIFRKYNPMKVKGNSDFFTYNKGMYIIDNEGIHITSNGVRVIFYLEGISTPIKMSNIEKKSETVEYLDLHGKKQKSTIQKIKGLKFDAKILDVFANRRFAEIFTAKPIKMFEVYLLLFSVITIIMIAVSYGLEYFY